MAMKLLSTPTSLSHPTKLFFFSSPKPISRTSSFFQWRSKCRGFTRKMVVKACVKVEEKNVKETSKQEWGKVSAVLFDMDGVLCNSENPSRKAAVDVFAEMGVQVTVEDFMPFTGMGEANFLGGVASVKGVKEFDPEAAKKRFFEIYLDEYAKSNSGIGFPGALELITQCKSKDLKVAVASSADRIKVDANLAAAGLPFSMFDAIVSADAFENLKPAPDIFLAASKILDVPPDECIVIEDALAGVQAAKAAKMRCIAVTTTLTEETLKDAGPSIIRNDIGSVSLDDILSGDSDEMVQDSLFWQVSEQNLLTIFNERTHNGPTPGVDVPSDGVFSLGELQGSRREILRYGSLGIALSCLYFAVTNWKAMQYASPKAIWNMLFAAKSPSFESNEGESRSARIQQFVNYISDLESRGIAPIVPEFPAKLDWLNTAPLQFRRDLQGKVVLLDFWTYCCINCMHVLPDLDFLEKKDKDKPFTVVGVHSAKFDNEKDLEAIRNAVLRYGITHPDLDNLVEAALLFYGQKKLLDNTTIPLNLEKDNDPRLLTSPLKFPGKLAIDVLNNRLFISDSNHNRIVVTDREGNFIVQIGSTGEEGLHDGSFYDATFNCPQGLAYNAKKNLLYVADTENHALREIDFVSGKVRTLAGNGMKGSDYTGGEMENSQLLNSPWDVCFDPVNDKVYIAMASPHQIWEHNTQDGVTKAFSGNGYERNLNGSSSTNASYAQPSGISLSPDLMEVYIADSESSSIRALDLKTGGSRLLAGGDPFGDHDDVGSDVLLQHPLGVLCAKDGQIYIADSYNHKIKKLDPASKRVITVAGTGKAGFEDGMALAAQFSEPSGIIEAENGKLFIADTNNSVIRYLDLNKANAEILTLELRVQPPTPKSKSLRRLRRRPSADTQTVVFNGGSSSEGNLYLKVSLPKEYHFSKVYYCKEDEVCLY
ncbi:hypothetical protein CRYUN_Cryun16bG0004300 [Craigia yunnanensis]